MEYSSAPALGSMDSMGIRSMAADTIMVTGIGTIGVTGIIAAIGTIGATGIMTDSTVTIGSMVKPAEVMNSMAATASMAVAEVMEADTGKT